MARTEYPTNHPNARKVWSADVMKEALKKTYLMRFMGTDDNSMIQVKKGLKDSGDTEYFFLRMQLQGAGVQGDGTLEGNEEALAIYRDAVVIDQLRHAVRTGGKMSEQRVPYQIRAQARDGLADWWADRFDTWGFNQLGGASYETDTRYTGNQAAPAPTATTNALLYSQATTASCTSSSTAQFGLTAIDKCVELAKDNPLPIRPIRIQNGDFYVMFISPTQMTALKTQVSASAVTWYDIQRALVEAKGDLKSPIFSGGAGLYNGTVIHVSTRVPSINADDRAKARRAIFCGAQAGVCAYGKGYSEGTPFDWEEETFDYGNQLGVAAGCIGGLKKCQFDHDADGTKEDVATITVTSPAGPLTTI